MSFEWFRRLTRPPVQSQNPLAGKPLRYLIGADDPGEGADDVITEVPYGMPPVKRGISIGYCNCFDELNTGQYGPYEDTSDTAKQYQEGQIMADSQGWVRNLDEQFAERKKQGFEYIELDNCDAYNITDVIGAIDRAAAYGLKVIAKNPGLMDGDIAYGSHPNVYGVIVEKNAGTPSNMDAFRRRIGKPDMPIWFVFFGRQNFGAAMGANYAARVFRNMGVTYSAKGEYGSSEDILRPQP